MAESFQNIYGEETGLQPVDLAALLRGESPSAEWLIEPLLPAGKLCAIVSKRGEGKSLLMLDIAARLATGQTALLQPPGDPKPSVYLDMEMGPDDLYDRLTDLGYTPQHPLFDQLCQNLHYYLLPNLPPLDTEAGGDALEEIVERHQAALVVVDTISRVVGGAENEAEPYRDLYRNTETRLKRRRVTLARLDHLGKDPGRGSRGSSAKEDPLDVVWQMTTAQATGAIVFTLTKGRQGWLPRSVTIHRQESDDGTLSHLIPQEAPADWLAPLIELLDELGIDPATGVNRTLEQLKAVGQGAKRARVIEAVRVRRHSFVTKLSGSQNVGNHLFDENGNHPGNHREPPQKTLEPIDISQGTTQGTTPEPLVPGGVPTNSGNHLDSRPENDPNDTFADPDPADLYDLADLADSAEDDEP